MPRGNRTLANLLEVALESGRRAKRAAAAIEKIWFRRLTPYFDKKKANPDLRYFVELLGRHLDALGTELATGIHHRKLQLSAIESQKKRERKAAQQVRSVLEDIRFYLSRTLGRGSFSQYIGSRSGPSKLGGVALLGAGEKLLELLRDETMGWDRYPEDVCCMSRPWLATELEATLAEFRQESAASEPNRAKQLLATKKWQKERAEKLKGLAAGGLLLRALLSEAYSDLEALELPPKARKRKPANGKGSADAKARARFTVVDP